MFRYIQLKAALLLACVSILLCVPPSAAQGFEADRAPELSRKALLQDSKAAFKPCAASVRDRVLESTLDEKGRVRPEVEEGVELDCSLTLQPGDRVTKRLWLTGEKASGVTINCNGAAIIGSHWRNGDTMSVLGARNILVRKCNVHGNIRVYGVDLSGDALRQASYRTDHTKLLQAAASRNITFEEMTITGYGRNPFYVTLGATHVTLRHSVMRGRSDAVAIYLDAETAENIIKDNDIGVATRKDEQIAIDGSARNLIVGNRLSGLNKGGIFLYRNCGERGVIRHQGPEDNVIIDNVFYYNTYRGRTPAVWIAERQNDLPGYCGEDHLPGAPDIGSNHDNLDHAYRTVVARNRFVVREPNELIRVNDDPSYVLGNVRISDSSSGDRNSPCYVANGFPGPFLAHGKSLAMFDHGNGPRCDGRRLACNDGIVTESFVLCAKLPSQISVEQVQCRAQGKSSGCSGRAACPRGTSLVAAKVACNLEFGEVSADEFSRTPWSFAGIVKRSDRVSDGVCRLGSADISENGARLVRLPDSVDFSCKEHDENGGDCHIRVALACQRPDILPPSRPTLSK